MKSANPAALCFDAEDIPAKHRLAACRELYGRAIIKHDFEPMPDHPFRFRAVMHALPGLALASTTVSAVTLRRRAEHIDSDDLVLTITLIGNRTIRQRGREAAVSAGAAVLTSSADPGVAVVHATSQALSLRIPHGVLKSMVSDLDSCLLQPIAPNVQALRLLTGYAGLVKDTGMLEAPELHGTLVSHVHDLVAMALGASGDAAEIARGRGVPAARLRAIKADIVENLSQPTLRVDALAAQHRITPRYLRMLFESDGTTVTEFIVTCRLDRAYRMLGEPRFEGRNISTVAFACGFADLSYFNRTFRRRFGMTPSDVRETARSRDKSDRFD